MEPNFAPFYAADAGAFAVGHNMGYMGAADVVFGSAGASSSAPQGAPRGAP